MKTFFCSVKSKILLCVFILTVLSSCKNKQDITEDRFVVLSPEIAEILSFLGVQDKIVGVTAECDYPAELQSKIIVGNFGQVSLEKIIGLNPTIVFTTSLEQSEITEQLSKLNIKTVQLYPKNSTELINVIDTLGVICNKIAKADSLGKYIKENFLNFREIAKHRENKPRVFIEIYGDPIMSASEDAYLGQLLNYAGAENIFPKLIRDYARVSAEDVVKLNPEIIILTYPGISAHDIKSRKGWSDISAVQNDRIYTIEEINPDLLLRASPRNIEGIKNLIRILYNE